MMTISEDLIRSVRVATVMQNNADDEDNAAGGLGTINENVSSHRNNNASNFDEMIHGSPNLNILMSCLDADSVLAVTTNHKDPTIDDESDTDKNKSNQATNNNNHNNNTNAPTNPPKDNNPNNDKA